jgi:drug/metabolite transporter (DMT)-like permease
MTKKIIIGHLVLFLANIFFGLNTTISRTLIPVILSPYTLTFFRIAGAAVLFWIASGFVKREWVPSKDLVKLFFASILALVVNQLPFIVGLSMTSPIDASIVVAMMPIVTMVFATIILKEQITALKIIGILVGGSGALMLVLNSATVSSSNSNVWGNLLVFVGVISFSLYLTLFKKLISKYSPITIMKWMFLFGSILSYPFCHSSLVQTNFVQLGISTYLSVAYVVVVATFISYSLIAVAQKVLSPTTFSMYNYVQPVVASLVAVLIGIDRFGIQKAICALLVFSGVYIVTQSNARAKRKSAKKLELEF